MEEDGKQLSLDLTPRAPETIVDPFNTFLSSIEIEWVNLPNYQPGVLIAMLNPQGQDTEEKKDAFVVSAVDADQNFWQFKVEPEKTFEKARLN